MQTNHAKLRWLCVCALAWACVSVSGCSDDTGGASGGSTSGAQDSSGTSGTSGDTDGTSGTSGDADDTSGTSGTSGTDNDTSGTSGTSGTDNDTSGTSGTSGTDNDTSDTSGTSGGDDGDGVTDPCVGFTCRDDQRCDATSGVAACVNNTCADLSCGPTERCDLAPTGGALCKDIACDDDLDCPLAEFCDANTGLCAFDACSPSETSCDGDTVTGCAANGSGSGPRFTCASPAGGASACQVDASGNAYCGCEDDWDCPAYTQCEVGRCVGAGVAPTCLLPAEPFLNVLPTPEITWGGTYADVNATGSPFPTSSQSVMSAIVANLDDDNGDGRINELDFPEVIFTTFSAPANSNLGASVYTANGILRAVHGGGPDKGRDLFASCGADPVAGLWSEGDATDAPRLTCTNAAAILDSTAGLAVGDLDGDGVPEIVAVSEADELLIFSNLGRLMSRFTNTGGLGGGSPGNNPTPALVNLDHAGFAEVVIGRSVFTLGYDNDTDRNVVVRDRFQGSLAHGTNSQGPASCVADLSPEPGLEVISGSSVYRLPAAPAGAASPADCVGNGGAITPAAGDETAYCNRSLVVVWDGRTVNGNAISREGFCAVADVLGADEAGAPGPQNPLDGQPEVIVVNNGRLQVFNGLTGVVARDLALNLGTNGGPPNIDDFDGDGFPEIGTAFGNGYLAYDLQPPTTSCPAWPAVLLDTQASPGTNPPRTPNGAACDSDDDCGAPGEVVCNLEIGACTCLHNGWLRDTEDDSSRVTGSTVFDFNGDNAAEIVYNDECYFRIYNGIDGQVFFKEPSESRTRIEYPVVADVDNDGNAEIVFTTSNESGFCSERANNDPSTSQPLFNRFNNGLEVWGDDSDLWVSARRIWNQHTYHVTNVLESGAIPAREPANWRAYNGRTYNTYRSQPRAFGVAPDLQLVQVQVSSPDASCGQLSELLNIAARVANRGDLRVGPGVTVSFIGVWGTEREPLLDAAGQPLTFTLQTSLEPGAATVVNAPYAASQNAFGRLPDRVEVVIDASGRERECNEDNNTASVAVAGGSLQPDLRVSVDDIDLGLCFSEGVTISGVVTNDGSATATDIRVRLYAGNPEQGGTELFELTIPGPVDPGQSAPYTAEITDFPALLINVYAVVDPDDEILECNDGNNVASSSNAITCIIN
jgi:hypothetical protein